VVDNLVIGSPVHGRLTSILSDGVSGRVSRSAA